MSGAHCSLHRKRLLHKSWMAYTFAKTKTYKHALVPFFSHYIIHAAHIQQHDSKIISSKSLCLRWKCLVLSILHCAFYFLLFSLENFEFSWKILHDSSWTVNIILKKYFATHFSLKHIYLLVIFNLNIFVSWFSLEYLILIKITLLMLFCLHFFPCKTFK